MEEDAENKDTGNQKSPIGPIFSIILILALLIAGSVYFLKQRINEIKNTPNTATSTEETSTTTPNNSPLDSGADVDNLFN